MKFQITKKIEVPPSSLYRILCDISLRRNWIPIFKSEASNLLKPGMSIQSNYSFLKDESCTETCFRLVENKEMALTINSSKGTWTVFVVLVETENCSDVTVLVELESNAWLSSIMLWFEAGKLELFANEFLLRLKNYAESLKQPL
jgi:hypothetical protein